MQQWTRKPKASMQGLLLNQSSLTIIVGWWNLSSQVSANLQIRSTNVGEGGEPKKLERSSTGS